MECQTAQRRYRTWKKDNLKEIIKFLDQQYEGKLDLIDFSRRMGFTYSYASSIFVKDDMKLSRAENIAKIYGYQLRLYFPVRQFPLNNGPHFSAREKYPNAGNLTGLLQYIYDRNMTKNHISERIHHSNDIINRAAITGDIFLSRLNEIVKNLKINVIWEFTPIIKQ